MNSELLREIDTIVQAPHAEQQEIYNNLLVFAKRLKVQGMEQLETYDLFQTYHYSTVQEGPDYKRDAYEDVLDLIWGWCSPGCGLFPTALTNEMTAEYKRRKNSS